MEYVIERLEPSDYPKCSNIWDMDKQPLAQKWLEEIVSGNRIVFVYKLGGEFIGEGALVINRGDPDYTIAGIEARVVSSLDVHTHTIFIGEVEKAAILRDGTPLTYANYHNIKKGKSPDKAPSFVFNAIK